MHQIIFANHMSGPFQTFVMDFEDEEKPLFSWKVLFDTISQKHGVDKKFLYIKDSSSRKIISQNLPNKFNLDDFQMFSTNTGKPVNDYLINFGIYLPKANIGFWHSIKNGKTLKRS
jgi:hypothetical protein